MKKINKKKLRKYLLIFSILLFVGCLAFLLYYLVLQPHYSKQVNQKYRDIYHMEETATVPRSDNTQEIETETEPFSLELDDSYKNNAKNSKGILLKFSKLLEYNSDIKGWLTIPGTGIDYPVMQDYNKGDFYLKHDFEGNKDKNGCLYVDGHCSVKKPSKNIVIHGHNMESTKMMFYELPNYKNLDYYKEHPTITFDSIYRNGTWKIIALLRVSGVIANNGTFNYMQSSFENDNEFLDFLYQIEQRSLYKCPVDVNEKDSLLMLSTCTYEVDNYRTVVVARKVRKGESKEVDTSTAYLRNNVLYSNNWYSRYGGTKPLTTNFVDALSFGEIDWYDGKITVESSIGKIIQSEGLQYQITSATTLKYIGCPNPEVTDMFLPSTVTFQGRTYDVNEMSSDSFNGMTKLRNLKIGNKVLKIEPRTFASCVSLESVIIGDSVTSIGKKAFYNLPNLNKVKIRSLNLQLIEEKAFKGTYEKIKFKLPASKLDLYSQMLQASQIPKKAKYKEY